MFAKIFESEKYGQILVKRDQGEGGNVGYEIRFFFDAEALELGICSYALGYPDTDAGYETCLRVFDAVTEERAVKVVETAWHEIVELMGNGEEE